MIFITVLSLGCIALIYVYKLSHNTMLGWSSLLAVRLYDYTFGSVQFPLGGLHLSPVDGILICLLAAGILRTVPRLKERNTPRLIGFAYLIVFLSSYVQGIFGYGFPTASNEARGYVGALTGILYFITAPVDQDSIRKYIDLYLLYGGGLVVTGVLAYAGLDVGAEAWTHHADVGNGIGINGRLLPAGAAAALAICFLFSLARLQYHRRTVWLRCLCITFLCLAIYLRHRTIWVMLGMSLTCLPFVEPKVFRRMLPILLSVGLVLAAALVFLPNVLGTNASEFQESAQNSGTWVWRLNSWRELVWDEEQTPITALVGKPLGSGYWRFDPDSGTYENFPPHSEYVGEYTRVGIVGMAFLLWYAMRSLTFFWRQRYGEYLAVHPSAGIWFVVGVAILVYGVTYGIEADTYALLGFGNAITVHMRMKATEEDTMLETDRARADVSMLPI